MPWGKNSGHLQVWSWTGIGRTDPGDPIGIGVCPGAGGLTQDGTVAGVEVEGSCRVTGKVGTELVTGLELDTEVTVLGDLLAVRARDFRVLLWVASSCSSTSSKHFMKPRREFAGPWVPAVAEACCRCFCPWHNSFFSTSLSSCREGRAPVILTDRQTDRPTEVLASHRASGDAQTILSSPKPWRRDSKSPSTTPRCSDPLVAHHLPPAGYIHE